VKVPFNVNHFPNLVHHDMEKKKQQKMNLCCTLCLFFG